MNILAKEMYRRLEVGEKIEKGDLAQTKGNKWPYDVILAHDVNWGATVRGSDWNYYYRLKTPSETFSEPKPPVGLQIKFKRLTDTAKAPERAFSSDAAFDLFVNDAMGFDWGWEFSTGIAVEIPEGYFGLLRPRSSLRVYGLIHVSSGIIDSGYRGEIKFSCSTKHYGPDKSYDVGDKCCQLIILPLPKVEFVEVQELSPSPRGAGGHGSTGV